MATWTKASKTDHLTPMAQKHRAPRSEINSADQEALQHILNLTKTRRHFALIPVVNNRLYVQYFFAPNFIVKKFICRGKRKFSINYNLRWPWSTSRR